MQGGCCLRLSFIPRLAQQVPRHDRGVVSVGPSVVVVGPAEDRADVVDVQLLAAPVREEGIRVVQASPANKLKAQGGQDQGSFDCHMM